ncbi:MAG TPA: PH domain-containing protein, partial [Acidobacteriaceae bacterium]|nr:PH domain-containing protein [Acidobacteriaceae bacterium]
IDKTLVPGEHVVYETRLHWIVMIGHTIFGLILLALAGFLAWYGYHHPTLTPGQLHAFYWGALAAAIIGIIILIAGSIRRNATEMAVTNRRVVIKTGLAGRRTIEMLLNKVETIEVTEPGLGRVFGYGSIVIIGTGGTSEPFHKMAHPVEFRNRVQMEIERLQPGTARPIDGSV